MADNGECGTEAQMAVDETKALNVRIDKYQWLEAERGEIQRILDWGEWRPRNVWLEFSEVVNPKCPERLLDRLRTF